MAADANYRIVILLACCFHEVAGNGRLIIPPQRSSIWRDSASWGNPQIYRNYNDHTLNCGGLWVGLFQVCDYVLIFTLYVIYLYIPFVETVV